MSILLGKSVDFVVLRRHLNRCGFMDEHVSTFVSQPGWRTYFDAPRLGFLA
jgi:hypothetical protein